MLLSLTVCMQWLVTCWLQRVDLSVQVKRSQDYWIGLTVYRPEKITVIFQINLGLVSLPLPSSGIWPILGQFIWNKQFSQINRLHHVNIVTRTHWIKRKLLLMTAFSWKHFHFAVYIRLLFWLEIVMNRQNYSLKKCIARNTENKLLFGFICFCW